MKNLNKKNTKLFSNLKAFKKGLKTSFANVFNSNQNQYKTIDNFVKLYKIPECISKNPEFNQIAEIFNIGDSIGNWQIFEAPKGEDGCLVECGIGFLMPKKYKFSFSKNKPAIQFKFETRSSTETNETSWLNFDFKINDDEIVDKLVSYPKNIDFQVFSKPDNFKSENDIENLNKIVKVSEKTYGINYFIMYFNEIGQRLQPLKNEWCAIELVGISKPKAVNVVENLVKEWQDFNKNISNKETKEFIR